MLFWQTLAIIHKVLSLLDADELVHHLPAVEVVSAEKPVAVQKAADAVAVAAADFVVGAGPLPDVG